MEDNCKSISISTGTLFRVLFIGLAVFLVYVLRDLVLVLLTSIVLASFIEAAANKFSKFKINRTLAVVAMYALSLFVLVGIFYLFAPILVAEIYDLSSFLSTYIPDSGLLNALHSSTFAGAKDIVSNLPDGFSISDLLSTSKTFVTNVSGGFFQTISLAFGGIFNFILIIVISFYLSMQEKGIENFLRIVIPLKHEDYAVDLWNRTQRKIALWVKGQLLLGLL